MPSILPSLHSVPATSFVSRNDESNFKWDDLKGKTVLGGRAGGMPEMLLSIFLRKTASLL